MSTLDNLKKEAKRRLKAQRAAGGMNDLPALREVQHALAREHGHESWAAMAASLEHEARARPPADIVAAFLEFACWDHHIHGKSDHRRANLAAQRLLAQHPDIAGASIYTAIVCGEIGEVRRRIAVRPEAAVEPGGPRGWTPLLYLCFTRFTHRATLDTAVEIARLLLDNGADPNDFYMAGSAPYSALVGAAGEGEQDSPRQPWGSAMFDLLLERGAKPFDQQVLYNTHFSGDVLWWLELLWTHTQDTPLAAAWRDPEWKMLDMGGYGTGAEFLVKLADRKENSPLMEWLLAHGANPAKKPAPHPPMDIFAAAARDRVDLVAEFLDQGVSPNVEDATNQRPLHAAAAANAVNVARLLIARGADIDPRETRWHAPPIGFAGHHHHVEMLDLLSQHSRELYTLCANGYVDRVREVLRVNPELAKTPPGAESLLFWLPDDENKALAVVDMLLANGIDAGWRDLSGRTPADVAERRAMPALAARLRSAEGDRPAPIEGHLEKLDSLAHDLVHAYHSGDEPAIERLRDHFHRNVSREDLRRHVHEMLGAIPAGFALPEARLLIARAVGCESWEALAKYHQAR